MASPTAIPNANKSGHHRNPHPAAAPLDLSSEIRSSEGQRLSFSPPSYFYSRASVSGPLYTPIGMASTAASSSPPNRFSFGSLASNRNEGSGPSPPPHHARARSHTAIGTCARDNNSAAWDERVPSSEGASTAGSQASSYISSSDLAFSRSPTSPGTSFSSASTGYSLGRVPSLPLGASYEQAQKRFNSGSWNQKMGWMNTMRGGPLSPTLSRTSIEEGNHPEDAGQTGSMGNLLRRFSLSGNAYRANNAPSAMNASNRVASAPLDVGDPASKAIPITRDSGIAFADPVETVQPPQRGRQASFGANTKRKPSPMGERLLMGHFNAH